MRMSLPKALAFSIAALFLGGALAATPALAVILLHGGGGGGFSGGGGGGFSGGGGGGFYGGGGGGFYKGGGGGFYGGGGGGMGGSYHPVGGGIGGMARGYHPVGGPSSHDFVSGKPVSPSGNAAPHVRWIPHAGQAWTGGPNRLASFSRRHHHHHRHGWGGGVFLPGYCDIYYDNYCNNGYIYDQERLLGLSPRL